MSDPQRPTAAGMYDYYLGGTAHTPADAAAAEQVVQLIPETPDTAWAGRGFLQRAVRWLAAEQGIRQFLDIGAGLPTQRNTHDVVAEVTPDGRVVYVDIDPAAVARGNEIIGDAAGAAMIEGDVRDPGAIRAHPETRRLIDFTQPVGLLLVQLLQFVPDADDPWGLVGRYRDALASGSYVALTHISVGELVSEKVRERTIKVYSAIPNPPSDRSKTEIERFFEGMEVVPPYEGAPPSLVHVGLWGAEDPALADSDGSRLAYAAVARKP